MSRLLKKYQEEIRPALKEKFGIENVMCIPKLQKVVVNMGIAEATRDRNVMEDHVRELSYITGQKPIVTKARISIANFKLREGQAIGAKVTMRGKRMYDFVDRFLNIAAPRIRDFRGFLKKTDGMGNYTLGIDSQEIFPEVDLDKMKRAQGMHITFVTTATGEEEVLELLKQMGMPFKESERSMGRASGASQGSQVQAKQGARGSAPRDEGSAAGDAVRADEVGPGSESLTKEGK